MRSRDLYTNSANLTAWCHNTRRQRSYDDILLPHNNTYGGPHLKCPIFLQDFNKIWSFSTDFHEVLSIKSRTNPSGASSGDTCRQTDSRTHRRTNTVKLTSAFRDYAHTPKTSTISRTRHEVVSCPYARQGHTWKWRYSSTRSQSRY